MHPAAVHRFLKLFNSLAFVIANGGTVSIIAPLWSGNFSSEVFGKGFKYYNMDLYIMV